MALECAADVRVPLSSLHTIMHGQGGWQPVPEHDQTPGQHGVALGVHAPPTKALGEGSSHVLRAAAQGYHERLFGLFMK